MVKDRFIRQWWISAGIIVASIAIAAGILYFFSEKLSAEANAIVTDREMLQEKTDAVAELAQLEADAPPAARYQAAIDQLLPNQYGLVTFTQWLGQLGTKYNVTANAAFQGSVVPSSGTTAGAAQFSFSAEGSPSDVAAFLDDMNARSSGFIISLASFDVVNNGANETVTGQGTVFSR